MNVTFVSPPNSPNTSLVSKLKHHVPKRLSLPIPSAATSSSRSRSQSRPSPSSPSSPQPIPAVLKIRIEAARDLLPKDRNGKSDPFLKLSLSSTSSPQPLLLQDGSRTVSDIRHATLAPVWFQSDLQLDFGAACLQIILFPTSLVSTSVKLIIFDKDRVRNDYLGELEISLADWFAVDPSPSHPLSYAFDSPDNQPRWLSLTSSRTRSRVTGEVLCKIGFLSPASFPPGFHSTNLTSSPSTGSLSSSGVLQDSLTPPASSLSNATHFDFSPQFLNMTDIAQLVHTSLAIATPAHPQLASDETEEHEKQKRVNRILRSNKKLRAIVFRKIKRKSGSPTTPHASGDSAIEEEEYDEASLSRGEALLSAHPTHSVGTQAKNRSMTGKELSEAIGERAPAEADQESLYSGESEIDEDEADLSAESRGPLGPSDDSTLTVPPVLSRTSSSSSKKLLFIPSALSKKIMPKKSSSTSSNNTSPEQSTRSVRIVEPSTLNKSKSKSRQNSISPTTSRKSKKFHQRLRKQKSDHSFKHGHLAEDDILGICFVEIERASGLPYWKNVTRTGFDMDPFVIISFGEKIFRTRVIRHSLDPVWDERLFFHVKRHELDYSIQMSLFDWDKMSSNDYIGEARLRMADLVAKSGEAMSIDSETGLYKHDEHGKLVGDQMASFEFAIPSKPEQTSPNSSSSSSTLAKLFVKAKYVPYTALRQVFWRKYLESFDTDESRTMSKFELVSMLDSIGSTLTPETIESFFARFGKSSTDETAVLSFDQLTACLEAELVKRPDEKRRARPSGLAGDEPEIIHPDDEEEEEEPQLVLSSGPDVPLGFMGHTPLAIDVHEPRVEEDDEEVGDGLEKVINISRCPICHKDRINSRMEIDIVTHLAVCASTDWSSVRHILSPGNFVTSNQASRKWLTKVLGKVQNGAYGLGVDSANILVKDRASGALVEEKMQVVVRLGIRLMYRSGGSKSRMEKERVRSMLKSLTLKQGVKYDSPESRREIEGFVSFHGLDMTEVARPIESFKSFNEFFYRELKPGARLIEGQSDPGIMVSCADCRMMAFEDVSVSRSIWIKGIAFGLGKVLGPRLGSEFVKKDKDDRQGEESRWALGIFRLAPQDYHRFHCPVDGVVEAIESIEGQYYTVNPMAIRSTIDVYGENVRVVVVMKTEGFGTVYCVLVGAMMVGSIAVGVKVGDRLEKGDELGYFAFGGSTILVISKSDRLEWDEDLLSNSKAPIETLVRVGNRVGSSKKPTSNTFK